MEARKIIITGGATRIGAAIASKLSGPNKEILIHYNKSKLKAESLKTYDAVAILTDHSNVDYELVKKQATLIIDTRNVYPLNHDKKIFRLGVGKKD